MKSLVEKINEEKTYKFHTEWFDEYYERGNIGIETDSLEEAKKWCQETCKKENNTGKVYLVRDHKYPWFDEKKKAIPYVCCLDKESLYHDYDNLEELK